MHLAVSAVSSAGVSPIVRVPASEHWQLKRALDAGCHAVMVPMCETPEQAEAVVRACKYPGPRWPRGNRGAGAMFAHHAFDGRPGPREYYMGANDGVMVCVQIESRTAVENIEAIASVQGLDMLFVGPNDLASSMGFVAFDHAKTPEVQEAIAKVLRVGKEKGKFVGHFALSAEEAGSRWEQGWEFVNCGADLVAVMAWMGGEMGRLKGMVEKGRGA
ncbi:uncharacterized protein HMPREF1541_05118 [Cyphellophora europaea CBS 101466]|uniref:HpcH/HpaI aldolase/citrate lyase domain-containing protein n=1 Tax=Cyphellophora europaea (strain CBS 101466) TaxID=1220924 RepID=W2RYG9_CYPE1|nr:uncharacterized protein HMPREF1541_05118 [Cyphellophora europaea CBS 101466]ETN40838.1 hypothetical protein HMPREF1541_05118 [Cyphellophora europaea CBS 101466]